KEHKAEFPGVQLPDSYLRKYPYQSLAAQLLGYTGQISKTQLKDGRKLGYRSGDIVGQAGIEATYDRYLRRHDGSAQPTVDSRGRPKTAVQPTTNPRPGYAVRLTLDIKLQRAAERAIKTGIDAAHADGRWAAAGGAIVALDPRDGSVLAMASSPTYKPSVYVGRPNKQKLAPLLDPKVAGAQNYPAPRRAIHPTDPP